MREVTNRVLSGSSARLLSREVATSMRGRDMEVLVHPFSLREALRHRGAEPMSAWTDPPKAVHSTLEKHFRAYLSEGGFPESQGVAVSAPGRTDLKFADPE